MYKNFLIDFAAHIPSRWSGSCRAYYGSRKTTDEPKPFLAWAAA
jgi:hypothetical protein